MMLTLPNVPTRTTSRVIGVPRRGGVEKIQGSDLALSNFRRPTNCVDNAPRQASVWTGTT